MNKLMEILLQSIESFQVITVEDGVYVVFDGNDEEFFYSKKGTKKLFKQAEKMGFRRGEKFSSDEISEVIDFKR